MRVEVVVIGLNQPKLLHTMFETARKATTHELQFRMFLHSLHEGVMRVCDEQIKLGDVVYYPYGTNRGVARSWNEGILDGYAAGADVVLVVNDDMWFTPEDIDKIAEAAVAHRDYYVVFGMGTCREVRRSMTFGCFVLNPLALERVGCFDENFFPVSHEDADYALRAWGCGLQAYNVETTAIHHLALATRQSSELQAGLEGAERRCSAYFVRKWGRQWGGSKEGEWFRTPFNDPQLGYYISPEDRHAPYPGYNEPGVPYVDK